jgi:outer membrane murein-binding lipoprotein Lpp
VLDHDDLILQLQETTDRSIRNEGRIKKLETEQTALRELATSVSTLATKQGIMEDDVKEIKSDVKEMAGKSGKRWDAIVDKLIWAVLAAIVAFMLGRLGL